MADLYLGIDTSNYKTSVAVTDSSNNIVFERSEFLEVPQGSKGLRQSEAFFRHSSRLPYFIDELCSSVPVRSIAAAGVSARPRRAEGSYMPCFLAGVNAAREITSVLSIPLHEFSHQEGHAAAIIEEPGEITDSTESMMLFHLSGGTTEFLKCRQDERGYELLKTGGTKDISFGQLIDRIGVALGMPFPSGPYMDKTALEYSGTLKADLPRVRLNEGYFNLSGIENSVLRITDKASDEMICAAVRSMFDLIASILADAVMRFNTEYGTEIFYMAGGVASSSYIRSKINMILTESSHRSLTIRFGRPLLSGDNAVGTARLARRIQENR